jgi:cytochrome c-type protein NapB
MPAYSEIGDRRRGPNADMYVGAVEELAADKPGLYDPVVQSPAEREAVIVARAGRRAYDGAPPTIPHEVKQREFPDCLACHGQGAKIAGKRAPRMSHTRYDNCTQCHVPSAAPAPLPSARPIENEFAGLASPGPGTRAWPGAPPTIPHSTHMRSECSSCHGVGGVNGIRSTHPSRQSCTQCHAPNALLDQRGP